MNGHAAPPTLTVLTAALAWCNAGFSVIRVAPDGTKRPLGTWKGAMTVAADTTTVTRWFTDPGVGLGLVMGAVSGHAEMFELEARAVADDLGTRLADLMTTHGLGELWQRLLTGYVDISPTGGLHLIYRVEGGVGPNTKLARRPAGTDDRGHPHVEVLLETRGEGGFTVVAPTGGTVHPTGRPWMLAPHAEPGKVITLTPEERDSLHAVATLLDEMPAPTPEPDPLPFTKPTNNTTSSDSGVAPGTDYNQRGDWETLLIPHGWHPTRRLAHRTYWTRPGKTVGISAVTGGESGDYFWAWTTSTDLPTEAALSKWRVYALLNHGGDFRAAAKALKAQGYGRRPDQARATDPATTRERVQARIDPASLIAAPPPPNAVEMGPTARVARAVGPSCISARSLSPPNGCARTSAAVTWPGCSIAPGPLFTPLRKATRDTSR